MLRTQHIELRSAEFAALPFGSALLGERSFISVFAAAAAALLQGAAKRQKLPEQEKKTDLNALYLGAATREKPPALRRCLAAPPTVLVGMAARGCQGRPFSAARATLDGHAPRPCYGAALGAWPPSVFFGRGRVLARLASRAMAHDGSGRVYAAKRRPKYAF